MAPDYYAVQEKMRRLDAMLERLAPPARRELQELDEALDVSWIHHDAALDGEMLDGDEILAALQGRPAVAGSTPEVAKKICTIKGALEAMRLDARQGGEPSLNLFKKLHVLLCPEESARGGRYRRVSTLHRSYFHEIAKPSRISYLLRRLLAWLGSEEARRYHPILVAAQAHFRMIRIYPFESNTGRVCRLFMNHLLISKGYVPAIIHARDRQRYYQSFKAPDPAELTGLISDSLSNSIDSCLRFLDQRLAASRRGSGQVA